MGKTNFLKHYQNNLCQAIQERLDEWRPNEFMCTCEDHSLCDSFNGFIDISIKSTSDPRKIVATEIEHKSSYEGPFSNIKKMKT